MKENTTTFNYSQIKKDKLLKHPLFLHSIAEITSTNKCSVYSIVSTFKNKRKCLRSTTNYFSLVIYVNKCVCAYLLKYVIFN